MTIMLPRNARHTAEAPRVNVVPPAEVWDPENLEATQNSGFNRRSNCGQNVRTLSNASQNRRAIFEQQPGGFGVQKVRTHDDPGITSRGHRDHLRPESRLDAVLAAESAAAAKRNARADRMQNLIAGSVFGLLLAAGIALFTPAQEMDAPVPATVVPNAAVTQMAE